MAWMGRGRGRVKAVRAAFTSPAITISAIAAIEQVGRGGEQRAGVAHAAQVAGHEQHDHDQADRDHGRGGERRDRGGDGFDAGGDRDGDREDVVDDQPGAGEQPPAGPEAVARDDVGAAAVGVGRITWR